MIQFFTDVNFFAFVVIVLFAPFLNRDQMEEQEAEQLPMLFPEVAYRKGVAKERVMQRVHSWAIQNEMRNH